MNRHRLCYEGGLRNIVKCTTTRSVICKINLDWISDSKVHFKKSFEKNLFFIYKYKTKFSKLHSYFLMKQLRIYKTLRMKCITFLFLILLCIIWFFSFSRKQSITYTYRKKLPFNFSVWAHYKIPKLSWSTSYSTMDFLYF